MEETYVANSAMAKNRRFLQVRKSTRIAWRSIIYASIRSRTHWHHASSVSDDILHLRAWELMAAVCVQSAGQTKKIRLQTSVLLWCWCFRRCWCRICRLLRDVLSVVSDALIASVSRERRCLFVCLICPRFIIWQRSIDITTPLVPLTRRSTHCDRVSLVSAAAVWNGL